MSLHSRPWWPQSCSCCWVGLTLRGFRGTRVLHVQVRNRPQAHTATKLRPVILITGWGLKMDLMTGEF